MNMIPFSRKNEHAPAFKKIIMESLGVLLAASLLSTLGGIGLEALATKFASILPFLILLPALNDMVGDFGTLVAAKFTSALYMGHIRVTNWKKSPIVRRMFLLTIAIALFSSIYLGVFSVVLAIIKGWQFSLVVIVKVLGVSLVTTATLVTLIFFISIVGGFYVYKKGHDPDNYLIPIATSLADLGTMAVLSLMLLFLF